MGLLTARCADRVEAGPQPDTWTLIAFLSDDAGLAGVTAGYLDKLQASTRLKVRVAYVQRGSARYRLFDGRRAVMRTTCSGDASEQLADLVRTAAADARHRPLALIVVGHGTPAALISGPFEDRVSSPGVALRGGAGSLSPERLADAIRQGLVGNRDALDLLAVDACYGGSVEVGAAVRGVTRVLVASPGPLYAPGVPWDVALSGDSTDGGAMARDLGRSVVRAIAAHQTTPPSPLVALDESKIDAVLAGMNAVAEALARVGREHDPVVTTVRGRTTGWGDNRELCDLTAFAGELAELTYDPVVRERAQSLRKTCSDAIIDQTLGAAAVPGAVQSALAVVFPPALHRVPNEYMQAAERGGYRAWAEFVRSYLDRMRSLVQPSN